MIKEGYLFLNLGAMIFVLSSCSDWRSTPAPTFRSEDLMTAQDILQSAYSNISITNNSGAFVTAAGLFIPNYDINDCSFCSGSIVAGNNAGGALVQPVNFESGQSIRLGQNYLYNLIYNGINFITQTVSSSPCLLPGCSWPGDSTSLTGWCISINLMSRNSAYTSSSYVNGSNLPANVVPYANAVQSGGFNYNYNLINPSTLGVGNACLGPIVCNDETLTCSVTTPQSQTFQAY